MPIKRFYLCLFLLGFFLVTPLLRAEETMKVQLIDRSVVYGCVELKFALKNPSKRKLFFIGTGSTSPAYELQLLKKGQWQDYQGAGWCGNAMDIRETSKSLTMYIDTHFAGKTSFRVGVRIFQRKPSWNSDGSANMPKSSIIWSEPVNP